MNGSSKARAAVYLAGLVASLASAWGLVDYDAATQVVDVRPFNITAAIGAISSGLALLAVWLGWGKKE